MTSTYECGCFFSGENPNKTAEVLAKKLNSDLNATRRLVMTESAYFATQGQIECYKELNVEEYEILGTLDSIACETCGSYDSKHFPTKEMQVGINAPPFHPNCRCTTIPYFNDEFTQNEKRAARDENGKSVLVDKISYEDWKKKYIKEHSQEEFDFKQKKAQNLKTDREQYNKYKSVLGKNAPKTLEEFQRIKYNDSEMWEDIKYYYRNIGDRPFEYVAIDREIEKIGIKGKGKAYPVEKINIKDWSVHSLKRMEDSGLNKKDAMEFMEKAVAMMKRYPFPNTQQNYYSDKGILGVKKDDGVVQTVIGQDRFEDTTYKILEVMNKWLK